jgi:hypothetical protein
MSRHCPAPSLTDHHRHVPFPTVLFRDAKTRQRRQKIVGRSHCRSVLLVVRSPLRSRAVEWESSDQKSAAAASGTGASPRLKKSALFSLHEAINDGGVSTQRQRCTPERSPGIRDACRKRSADRTTAKSRRSILPDWCMRPGLELRSPNMFAERPRPPYW